MTTLSPTFMLLLTRKCRKGYAQGMRWGKNLAYRRHGRLTIRLSLCLCRSRRLARLTTAWPWPLETDSLFTDWPAPAFNPDELSILFWINLGLAVLPLLPTFVAGRDALWVEVLSRGMDRSQAVRVTALTEKAVALGAVLAGVVYSPVLASFGVLLFAVKDGQWETSRRLGLVKGVTVKQVMSPHLVRVQPTDRVREIMGR